MPRPKGALNQKTIDEKVEAGDLCLIAHRMNCAKCKLARETEGRAATVTPTALGTGSPEMHLPPLVPYAAASAALPAPAGPTTGMLVDTFIEYKAPDGKEWRVERGIELLRDFDLQPAQIKLYIAMWHTALAAQERVWLIVRRIYGVAPMLGTVDPDDLRAWPAKELGEKLGLSEEQIGATIGETRTFWLRYRIANPVDKKAVKLDSKAPMTEEELNELLVRYGLNATIGEAERRYAAGRCRDLAPYLENEQGMPIARSAIQQDLNLMALDGRISAYQAWLQQKRLKSPEAMPEQSEDKRLTDLMKARAEAGSAFEDTMKALGLQQVQTGNVKKRMGFQLSIGTMNEAMQRYYAGAGNDLIDGFATEGEIELVIREKELRPMQYRPDVVIMAQEAMEHLWEKNYEPSPIGRNRVRRLRNVFRTAIKAALAEEGEVGVDSAEAEMLGDEQGPALPAALPGAVADPGIGQGAGTFAPRTRGDGDSVAVF